MHKKQYTEDSAAQALLSGEEAALDFFFHLYYTPLTFFALKTIQCQDAAEDIVAEAFIKLWNNKYELKKESSIKAYLYKSVRNASIDYLRHQKIKSNHQKEVIYLNQSSDPSILSSIIEFEIQEQLHASLQTLPPRLRRVLRLYLEGRETEEIAKELGITINSVYKQKCLATKLLKKNLSSPFILLLLVYYLN